MKTLRRWQLETTGPLSLQLAADARLSPTDYADDQTWELSLAALESPTPVLQTRYGGRAGLVSLVPMWQHEGRLIYQAQAYARPPYVTGFAPGYVRLQATLTPQLALQAEYWAMESHAIGARFTIANARVEPATIRLDLFGHVGIGGKEQRLHIIPLPDGQAALSLGRIGNLQPVLAMDQADADNLSPSPKIGHTVTIKGRKKAVLHWVHAGLHDIADSLVLAQHWLKQDWDKYFKRIAQAAAAIPDIETGDEDLDAAVAFSAQQLVHSYLKPAHSLPHHSFVAVRGTGRGFSRRGDGSDHDRAWSGQSPPLAYLTALGMASIDAQMAQGVVRNYLAVQQPDGWIDWKPGPAGQRQGVLCLPILARLAWGIFQYTEDTPFLNEVFPGLLKFFDRWFQPDQDADGDGLPEWQAEDQTGYVFFPTFAAWQMWGQKADIRLVETPDLLAYLLSEAKSLREIAYYLHNDEAEKGLEPRIERLQAALESLWRDGRYAYRDRDTHLTTGAESIISDARGDDELIPAHDLAAPNRLILEIAGGVNLTPRFNLSLAGADENGQDISETASQADFIWAHSRGAYTSRRVFSRLDRVTLDGLSRVYRVDVRTLDTTRLDINALLPLWSAGIPAERASALTGLLTDPAHFWRDCGVTMCSAQDANFDPSNADGSGGVWPFWLTLIGEGLIEYGRLETAAELLRRLLTAQTAVLKEHKTFTEFYHSDQVKGLGERGYAGGFVPLHLLLRVLGVRIISARKVWMGGPFVWKSPVTVRQHGVTVRRAPDGARVDFPSGHTVEVSGDAWQEIVDPKLA